MKVVLLIGACTFLGCCTQQLPEPNTGQQVRSQCPSVSSDDFFLPRGILAVDAESDARIRSGPSLLLANLDETSLSCGNGSVDEAYRLVWRHAFSNSQPVVIRATRSGSEWSVIGVQVRSLTDHSVAIRHEDALSNAQAEALVSTVGASRFWTTISSVPRPEDAFDGASWILEGRRGSAYHVVERLGGQLRRGSGELLGPIQSLGAMLVKLSGLPVSPLMVAD